VVSTDNADDVTLNHIVTQSGSFTTVNQAQFRDGDIRNGIFIQGGFDSVVIAGTVKPVTTDAEGLILVGSTDAFLNHPGSMQNILAPLSLGGAQGLVLDDRADPFGQNVTLNVVNEVVSVTGMAPAPIRCNVFAGFLGDFDMEFIQLMGGRAHNTFNV